MIPSLAFERCVMICFAPIDDLHAADFVFFVIVLLLSLCSMDLKHRTL